MSFILKKCKENPDQHVNKIGTIWCVGSVLFKIIRVVTEISIPNLSENLNLSEKLVIVRFTSNEKVKISEKKL